MPAELTIGQRIRHYREERGLTATQLAAATGLSKSYISELEAAPAGGRGPSAPVLYEIAKALGVAMADLLGKPVLVSAHPPKNQRRPKSLTEFGRKYAVPEPDLRMLESIQFRGEAPTSVDQWLMVYQGIKSSSAIGK